MSVLWLLQQHKSVAGALHERPVAPTAAEERCRSVAWASCGSWSNRNSVRECCKSVLGLLQQHWERCRSVLWLLQQQKQRTGALQERPVAPAAAETASGSVARASCVSWGDGRDGE